MTDRLCLKDTMTDRKKIFKPRKKGKVKLFTCGPSIYNFPHIGNYRTYIYEDILQRYLEYLGYTVDRGINFTDVEDKSIREARDKKITLQELTQPVADRFYDDCKLLQIKMPECIPRASTTIDQAVYLIELLIEKGFAYRHGKNVYFDPLKFKGFGKLYGLDMSRWPPKKIRFHKDTYPGQRWNLGDFILWMGRQGNDENDIYWRTSLGDGRPSWNIQDPAVITQYLGYQVDISCGGVDNLYRHHDYNIAVIEAISGKQFAVYWLHGEHVLVDGIKMSKSRKNVVYLQDLLEKGYEPYHIRFYLAYEHYRKKLNLNEKELQLARGKVDTFRELVGRISQDNGQSDNQTASLISRLTSGFEKFMNDDLDVKGAFEDLYKTISKLAKLQTSGRLGKAESKHVIEQIEKIDSVLQIL
jgi:cysteinyl-tRNA synthetase